MPHMYIDNVQELNATSILDDTVFEEFCEIDSEVESVKKRYELEERAKVLGVAGKFKAMLKAYRKDQEKHLPTKVDEPQSYVTEFERDGEKVALNCGVWIAGESGIYTFGERGRVIACPHPIYIDKILVNAETAVHKYHIWYKLRGTWRDTLIDRKIVASNNAIIQLADRGIQVTTNNSKALVEYLSELEALNPYDITEHNSTSRLGWINGTFMPYAEDVTFDNENALRTLFNAIPQNGGIGDREKWYDLMRELRKEHRIEMSLYMAASFGSILVELVGVLPFIVDLWGETGKGKTVALKVATSVWADPTEGKYLTDAKSTTTAIEVRLNTLNSMPMMVDDLAQIARQYDEDFSTLVYNWCSGMGKSRSNVNMGLNAETRWRCAILTNSEHTLVTENMQGGAVNRIIEVEMDEGYIVNDGHYVCNIINDNYGFAGREFVELVETLGGDYIRAKYQEWVDKIVAYCKDKETPKEQKQIMPMAVMMLADELTETYMFKDEQRLPFERCVDILKGTNDISEHERAYNYLIDTIVSNRSKFEKERSESYSGEDWGTFSDDNKYCIIIGTVFSNLLKKGGYQDKAFCTWAIKHDKIQSSNGRSRRSYRLYDNVVKCIFLKMPEDNEVIDSVEPNPWD